MRAIVILLIDNYDSFVYNIYQYLREYENDIITRRNDDITIEEISKLNPDRIIISPGPKAPQNAGNSNSIIKAFYKTTPILGICLGHQILTHCFHPNNNTP